MTVEVFLPKGLFARAVGSLVDETPCITRSDTIATYGPHFVPGSVLSFNNEAWERLVQRAEDAGTPLIECDRVLLKDQPTLVRAWSTLPHIEVDIRSEKLVENRNGVIEEYKKILDILSLKTGSLFALHLTELSALAPFPQSDGIVHVMCGAVPPGIHGETWYGNVFNFQLMDEGKYIRGVGPALGYGRIIYDPHKDTQPIAQIVENTIYILVPVLSGYQLLGSMPFEKTMEAAWNALAVPGDKESDTEESDAPEKVCELLRAWDDYAIDFWRSQISVADFAIKEAEAKLTELFRERKIYRNLVNAKEQAPKKTDVDFEAEYAQLRDAPGVHRVIRQKNAMLILTKRAYWRLDHPEKPIRFLGRYWIRFGESGKFGIWAEEYGHPKRILHPHISPAGVPCFGDLSRKLHEYITDRPLHETMALLWKWIEEGYNPETADTPVEEYEAVVEEVR